MRPDRVNLRNEPDIVALAETHGSPQACQTSTNDHHIMFEHRLDYFGVEDDQDYGNYRSHRVGQPEELLLFPVSQVYGYCPQAIDAVEREKNQYKDVEHGLPVKAKGPIRLVIFRVDEECREDLDTKQDDERNAADPVKEPDKHILFGITSLCWLSSGFFHNTCYCRSGEGDCSDRTG